jgi:hypothetical protein
MKLDRDSAKAILMGEISSDSKLYEMTNRYFNQTAFMTPPLSISFTAAFSEYPRHFNYLLYNL